jgi:hypothetical protein
MLRMTSFGCALTVRGLQETREVDEILWLIGLHIGLGDRFSWGWINDGYFDRQLMVLRDWEENALDQPGGKWLRPIEE